MDNQLTFKQELESLINRHSKENGSDTPDFILAEFLLGALHSFDRATRARSLYYNQDASLISEGVKQIADERLRQVQKLGHTPAKDKEEERFQFHRLLLAARCYLTAAIDGTTDGVPPADWPWHKDEWHPDPEKVAPDLIRAGALIAAHLDMIALNDKPAKISATNPPPLGGLVVKWERGSRNAWHGLDKDGMVRIVAQDGEEWKA